SGAVRPGADKADILATFDISDIPEAQQWLEQRDLASDEHEVILGRGVTAARRAPGDVNGRPSPPRDPQARGEEPLDSHSQHPHQALLKPDTHRRLLDDSAGASELARQVQLAAQRCRQTEQALEQASNISEEQNARQQLLSYQLEELDNLSLQDGELELLE